MVQSSSLADCLAAAEWAWAMNTHFSVPSIFESPSLHMSISECVPGTQALVFWRRRDIWRWYLNLSCYHRLSCIHAKPRRLFYHCTNNNIVSENCHFLGITVLTLHNNFPKTHPGPFHRYHRQKRDHRDTVLRRSVPRLIERHSSPRHQYWPIHHYIMKENIHKQLLHTEYMEQNLLRIVSLDCGRQGYRYDLRQYFTYFVLEWF